PPGERLHLRARRAPVRGGIVIMGAAVGRPRARSSVARPCPRFSRRRENGTMEENEKALRVDGLTFVVRGDEEPRIAHLDLAERLGFKRPRDIEKLIRRHVAAGSVDEGGVLRHRGAKPPGKGGRPSETYWLNEAAALFVAAKSDTEGGDAVLRDLVRLWLV